MSMRTIKRNVKYWWQRRTRGWSDDECFNIDWQFITWINNHLKIYLRDAEKIVDLEYYKFIFKGKEYTQKELVEMIIKLTDEIKEDKYWSYNGEELKGKVDDVLDIFKLIFWTLWW